MAWIAGLVALALSAYEYSDKQKTLRKQNDITTNAIIQRNRTRDEEAAAIKAASDKIGQNNAQKPIAAATQSYLSDLQNANPNSTQQAPATGAMSQAYQQAAGAANADVANKAKTAAGLMAITDAPGVQRQGEQSLIGQLGLNLSGINIGANDATNLAQMRARGVQDNPWIALAAAAARSYAGGKAGSGGGSSGSSSGLGGYGGSGGGGTQSYIGAGSLDGSWNQNANGLWGDGSLYGR